MNEGVERLENMEDEPAGWTPKVISSLKTIGALSGVNEAASASWTAPVNVVSQANRSCSALDDPKRSRRAHNRIVCLSRGDKPCPVRTAIPFQTQRTLPRLAAAGNPARAGSPVVQPMRTKIRASRSWTSTVRHSFTASPDAARRRSSRL